MISESFLFSMTFKIEQNEIGIKGDFAVPLTKPVAEWVIGLLYGFKGISSAAQLKELQRIVKAGTHETENSCFYYDL